MLLIISPAKKLDYDDSYAEIGMTKPRLLKEAATIADIMQGKSRLEIQKLMKLSDNLSDLNYDRYQRWTTDTHPGPAKQAILAFKGDVYASMNAYTFSLDDFKFAQKHLRILSGFYGLLRPLDMIQAHRLEMGNRLENPKGKDLYGYWQDPITKLLNQDIRESEGPLINLASNEYFKSVEREKLKAPLITPVFKNYKNGVYKIISLYAKRARGMMSAFVIQNRLESTEQLKKFSEAGYQFSATESDENQYMFHRKQ
ncbi:MAG: peroxide stress protein YaaA [Gammaproteobacteria bacterium]|nr:peroxide stress protein YaaA [Gammaproteobacteria bacterium]